MKKAIVFLCLGFNPVYGGNFIPSLCYLGKKLKGYDIIFIMSKLAKDRAWVADILSKGFKVLFIDTYLGELEQIFAIEEIMRNNNVVLVHSHFSDNRIPVRISRRNKSVKVILHNHSDFSADLSPMGKIKYYLKTYIVYHLLGRRMKVISVSEHFSRIFKVPYVPNGLVKSRVKNIDDTRKQALKKKFDCLNSVNILVFAWSPYIKGLDVAVDSVGIINNENVKLLIVYGGDGEGAIRKYINQNCSFSSDSSFLRYLPPISDTYDYLSMCDVFISASRSEGFSYCLLEAISVGKPSLMSNIHGTKWAERYGVTKFKSGSIKDCSDKTRKLVDSLLLGRDCCTNFALLRKEMTVENWANQIIKIYGLSEGRDGVAD